MSWKLEQARLHKAAELGETVAGVLGLEKPPIDPFAVIASEEGRIRAVGEDFGDAFDGRLEYHGTCFLLFFNTKYDGWRHDGEHHPKVRFTIGHELGHYFLEKHRSFLMQGGGSHGSMTEFSSSRNVEREADFFSTGLLMPRFLLRRTVNATAPKLAAVRAARDDFQVSLTSTMIRWVELCDFPCAVVSCREGRVEWGFTSPGFKQAGGWRVRRGEGLGSRHAQEFFDEDTTLQEYREGEGWSVADRWIELERRGVEVHEDYLVVPSTQQMLVFLTASEDDLDSNADWD